MPATPTPSCNRRLLSRTRTKLETASSLMRNCFDRSDQKTRIHVLTLISPGCGSNNQNSISLRCRKIRHSVSGGDSESQTCSLSCDVCSVCWWSQTGSNRRPHACKARALPTELWPHSISRMVGPGRLELPTSRLSGVRSNHLSYGPHWTLPARSISQVRLSER